MYNEICNYSPITSNLHHKKDWNKYARVLIWALLCSSPNNISSLAVADAANTGGNNDNVTPGNLTSDELIQARILDGVSLVDPAKAEVAQVTTAQELLVIADTWNSQAGGSGSLTKYVKQVQIDNSTGEIEVMFNNFTVGAISADSTLVFIPYIQAGGAPITLQSAIGAGEIGNAMDWGCASATNAVSAGQGLSAMRMGTLLSKYAPTECR